MPRLKVGGRRNEKKSTACKNLKLQKLQSEIQTDPTTVVRPQTLSDSNVAVDVKPLKGKEMKAD